MWTEFQPVGSVQLPAGMASGLFLAELQQRGHYLAALFFLYLLFVKHPHEEPQNIIRASKIHLFKRNGFRPPEFLMKDVLQLLYLIHEVSVQAEIFAERLAR
jgi:hypothetical protein